MKIGSCDNPNFWSNRVFPREIRVPLFILMLVDIEFADKSIELPTPPGPNVIF